MFYGGMVRPTRFKTFATFLTMVPPAPPPTGTPRRALQVSEKNYLHTVFQSFLITCLISCEWMIFGYSLALTPGEETSPPSHAHAHAHASTRLPSAPPPPPLPPPRPRHVGHRRAVALLAAGHDAH